MPFYWFECCQCISAILSLIFLNWKKDPSAEQNWTFYIHGCVMQSLSAEVLEKKNIECCWTFPRTLFCCCHFDTNFIFSTYLFIYIWTFFFNLYYQTLKVWCLIMIDRLILRRMFISFSPCPWNLRSIEPSDFKKKGRGHSFEQTWTPFIIGFFALNLVHL